MKKCPVCNASCFDDMKTCFGCMHSFGEENAAQAVEHDSIDLVVEVEEPPAKVEPLQVQYVCRETKVPGKINPPKESVKDSHTTEVFNAIPCISSGSEVRFQLVVRLEPVMEPRFT